jgi:adenylate cyclase
MTTTTTRCRRQTVTILFVDIVGYTALVEDLDCADVHDLQTDYFGTVSAVLACGGGVVEKYLGDAVMAVFGTDEGDAPHTAATAAVRAGWEVQDALRGRRYPVRTRVGLATGDVIIDRDAIRSGGYGMVSGSVVTTAARLQAYAPDDTVVVDASTRWATDELIAYQDLPPVAVAGRPYLVELWRALHPQAALCTV